MSEPTTDDTETLDVSALARLREPFPPDAIHQLPRAGTQLDYVGHAQVTDRLLAVDPLWTWEPFALDAFGLPMIERDNGRAVMWLRLTVCGHTRPGVGIVTPGDKPEVEKELISDGLRNAAMRFGVALDLWAKGHLESESIAHIPAWQGLGYESSEAFEDARDVLKDHAAGLDDAEKESLRAAHPWPFGPDVLPKALALIEEIVHDRKEQG
jgi:hypothetical protein